MVWEIGNRMRWGGGVNCLSFLGSYYIFKLEGGGLEFMEFMELGRV